MKIYKVEQNPNFVVIENAKIIGRWSDFGGVQHKDNRGNPDHYFEINFTDEDQAADELLEMGYNVKIYIPKNNPDPDAKPVRHLNVKMIYRDSQPWLAPKVHMVTTAKSTELSNETIGALDDAIIEYANVTLRLHEWEYMGRTGATAQLVDADFYVSGSRSYQPAYRPQPEMFAGTVSNTEPNQTPNEDDLPF